jgi:hypothetical protein
MAASGGVQVIPEKIRVRIDRGDALRTGSNVDQGVSGGRADDLVEEAKDVQQNKIEVSAEVEVAQDGDACAEGLVKEDACLCRGIEVVGEPLSRGTAPSGGRLGMMNWVAPAKLCFVGLADAPYFSVRAE